MGKHLKGSTGVSMGGGRFGRDKNWKARQERFLGRQQRLSGKCKVLFDRDTNTGALPPNLANKG
jgi:hypothetical protein